MAECYECGSYIAPGNGVRREVQTGRNSSVSFTSKGRMRHSSGSRYGKRTICAECAKSQDEANAFIVKTVGILILVAIAWVVISSITAPSEPKTASLPEHIDAVQISNIAACEQHNFPCSLNNFIEASDWVKIKSALIFSANFKPTPMDISWENEITQTSGSLRYLSINRDNCISYDLIMNENTHPLTVCRNPDESLNIE